MAASSYSMVIAIDFGTTFSGYAFSFPGKERDIFMYTKWGECVSIPSAFKAPTCVLTNKHGRFEAFGYEAQDRYSNLMPEETDNFLFFDKFKMHLHQKVSTARYFQYGEGPNLIVGIFKMSGLK